jgi:group I intron endonuclease
MERIKHTINESGIYQISNLIDGKLYIGSAVCIRKRWNHHKGLLRRGRHVNKHLQKAWNKYGEDNFNFEVVRYCEKNALLTQEQIYIDQLNAASRKFGYNLKPIAGSNIGFKYSDEARKNMSKAQKGHPVSEEQVRIFTERMIGTIPWNKGLKNCWPQEVLDKMVETRKGNGYVPWNKGLKMPEEHCNKLSLVHKGEVHTEEHKKKTSDSLKKTFEERGPWNAGWHHTEDAKIRIGIGAKGRIKSPEECKHISEAKLKYYAEKRKMAS